MLLAYLKHVCVMKCHLKQFLVMTIICFVMTIIVAEGELLVL